MKTIYAVTLGGVFHSHCPFIMLILFLFLPELPDIALYVKALCISVFKDAVMNKVDIVSQLLFSACAH